MKLPKILPEDNQLSIDLWKFNLFGFFFEPKYPNSIFGHALYSSLLKHKANLFRKSRVLIHD